MQDKVWVDAPDGEPWEIYTVLGDVEMPAGELRDRRAAPPTRCAARPRRSRPHAAADRAATATSRGERTAEAVGTAFLVAVVVGSGIAAQRLSPDNTGLQLLENSTATGAGLVALILAFGPVSGAHFNPVVTLADRLSAA